MFYCICLWIRLLFAQRAISQQQGHILPAEVSRLELSQTQPCFNVLKYTLVSTFQKLWARLNGNFDPPVRRYKLFC